MAAKILDVLGTHPVYGSVSRVLSLCAANLGASHFRTYPEKGDMKRLINTKTNTFSYSKLNRKEGEIYVLNSPLVFFEGWEFLLRRYPFIVMEEYNPKKSLIDALSLFLLGFSKGRPFLTQIKRTHSFLQKNGFNALLIPPAERKRAGSLKRGHILSVCRLTPSKNPLLFLNIASAFPKEKFVLIGKGEMEKEILAKAKSLPNLQIIPNVESQERLFEYYSNAKLFIHPAWKDPIGFVVIEALSTQTPVLASSGAGASDFLPKEWVADPKNAQEWIDKTRAIIASQKESITLAGEIFEKEHLNIDDAYFKKTAKELSRSIKKLWPRLFKG